ncbi:helix-turn-helix transcriptional regulator [Ornithinimicrobium avium]|uniref:Transcriptional regulator n=1 Tax=Ornithinimicrobium avium TaxID=2283195 RepID=A0A345NNC0_9MICO|nr:helix-turn-helix domain-containing protein [Ornithinimicrobium avium]AXH96528.1 transcriptional regulator [Ornithinimicrobium avium]
MPDVSTDPRVPSVGVTLLGSPVRRGVVEVLAALGEEMRSQGLTAAELGERLALHTTTIRFHVDQLVAAGVLDSHFVRSGGVGRPSKKYVLREDPLGATAQQARDSRPFEVLAGLLTATLSTEQTERLTPEQAGALWAQRRAEEVAQVRAAVQGARVTGTSATGATGAEDAAPGTGRDAKVAEVIALLGDWGYTPQTHELEDGTGVDVTLRRCPFIDLARSHPDVVCGVHRGLLRGALTAVGEPDARVSLEPFVGPDTCRARLYLTEDDQRSARP